MAYYDLREFIDALEENGELLHFTEQVDWNDEIGAICRYYADVEAAHKEAPAIMFENIKDYEDQPLLTQCLSSYRRFAIGLGMDKDSTPTELVRAFHERIRNPIKPIVIDRDKAECKQNIVLGDDIDITKLPVPQWHDLDGGRYIGTFHTFIQKSLENPDWVNWGMYRMKMQGPRKLGAVITPGQHSGNIWREYKEAGKRMEVAVAIGQDPTHMMVSGTGFAGGISEVDMAGALRGAPVELVPAETVDLLVPAHAEIIIEGYIDPDGEMLPEGPYGEFTGYYAGVVRDREVMVVTAVTYRDNPIMLGALEGMPILDGNIMGSVSDAALARQVLIDTQAVPGVVDCWIHPYATGRTLLVISCKRLFAALAEQCAFAVWSSKVAQESGHCDWVIVVEDDIDPSNFDMVIWSMVTRCNPIEGTQIIKKRGAMNPLFPKIPKADRLKGMTSSAILIDAGFPIEWHNPDSKEISMKADWNSWSEDARKRACELVKKNDPSAPKHPRVI